MPSMPPDTQACCVGHHPVSVRSHSHHPVCRRALAMLVYGPYCCCRCFCRHHTMPCASTAVGQAGDALCPHATSRRHKGCCPPVKPIVTSVHQVPVTQYGYSQTIRNTTTHSTTHAGPRDATGDTRAWRAGRCSRLGRNGLVEHNAVKLLLEPAAKQRGGQQAAKPLRTRHEQALVRTHGHGADKYTRCGRRVGRRTLIGRPLRQARFTPLPLHVQTLGSACASRCVRTRMGLTIAPSTQRALLMLDTCAVL